jgi:hypothetical protein
MYLLNESGEHFLAKYSSPPLYPIGIRFVESLCNGLDKSAINLADKSSPYGTPIY